MSEQSEQSHLSRFKYIFFKASGLNFLAFIAITLLIGGAATWGYQKDGHFFVDQHGRYVEVSKGLYEFSSIHGIYSVLTVLITLVGTVLLRNKYPLRFKLSLKEWALAAIVPLFWSLIFLIVHLNSSRQP